MPSGKGSPLKPAQQSEKHHNARDFRRRKLTVHVAIVNIAGDIAAGDSIDLGMGGLRFSSQNSLEIGSDGIASLEFASGTKIESPIRVVWSKQEEQASEYGALFEGLAGEERVAVMDAVYSPPGKSPLTSLFDQTPDLFAESVAELSAKPLSPTHHPYYLRLIRRIEQVHKLSTSQTDGLLFAVLQQGRDLAGSVLELNLTTYDKLGDYLGALYGVPYVNLNIQKPDATVADIIPESIAISQNVVPFKREKNGNYLVAMSDPLDLPTRDIVQLRTKNQFELRFAIIEDIERAVKAVYQAASLHAADRLIDKATAKDPAIELYRDIPEVADLETLRRLSDATPIISLVDSMLRSAVDERASDIHLEPVDDCIILRFRLDGVLHEMRTIPRNLLASVVSRIKIMAGMDISEHHIPQDGRISMRYAGKNFELRVASLPTVFGEKVVVRLLEKHPTFKTLRSIGFSEANYARFAPLIRRPYGMILFCGPTGSGKSTTLFACIQEIHDGTNNITTVEDPVEYRVRGINHVELNQRRGVTFASVLRSLLRSDPDVIYVGEIRDRETADLAVRVALTGHLLFSTLHTNTAIQAITRLVDIGVEGTLIGASLIAVVGQRLVRKICSWCKESYTVPADEAMVLRDSLGVEPPKKLQRGRGCSHCHETGFYGRGAVHEVVVVDDELRRLIGSEGTDATRLRDHLKASNFQDLRTDAVERMLKGETTLQEVIRLTI
ncbi:MAG: Flp pilus assembly complex ATPase component TadA [Candidatus Eremiobacteraeota bacterium]|nr:Flp pilus assembly complex ATPase component TadA [Candidatus Eremiobacteraeota bacterium]